MERKDRRSGGLGPKVVLLLLLIGGPLDAVSPQGGVKQSPDKAVARGGVEVNAATVREMPCRDGPGDRVLERCAQWKAADAAAQSAFWAEVSAYVGAVMAGVSLLALLATALAVLYARGAARASHRAAAATLDAVRAAQEGNSIVRDTAHAQTRPWVQVDIVGARCAYAGGGRLALTFAIELVNIGLTPAKGVHLGIATRALRERDFDPVRPSRDLLNIDIMPGSRHALTYEHSIRSLDPAGGQEPQFGTIAPMAIVAVEYDAAGTLGRTVATFDLRMEPRRGRRWLPRRLASSFPLTIDLRAHEVL